MATKLEKFLRTLQPKIRVLTETIIARIEQRNLAGMDMRKLKGRDNWYRVRHGDIRIIFSVSGDQVTLQSIGYRSDTTYR